LGLGSMAGVSFKYISTVLQSFILYG
jgi:hypothetical protein